MTRPPRQLLYQSYYHIITRGNNHHVVFKSYVDYEYYLDLIKRFKTKHPFCLFHYCLMPNHVHMLIKINKNSNFSTFMKKLNLAYFHHYRKNYGWVGHFWQDRFKSQPVGKDDYFIQCGKYIELNPVRARIVDTPGKYPYSSFNHYAEGKHDVLITNDFIYNTLASTPGEKQYAYKELVISEIITYSYSQNVWGTAKQKYQEKRKRKYNINSRLK